MKMLNRSLLLSLLLPLLAAQNTSMGSRHRYVVSAPAGIVHVQSCVNNGPAGTIVVTCGSAVGVGHLLYVSVQTAVTGIAIASITGDSGSVVGDFTGSNSGCTLAGGMAGDYILSTGGGETSLSVTTTGSRVVSVQIDEFSVPGGATLDVSQSGCSSNTGAISAGPVTTTANGDLLISQVQTITSPSATSPFVVGALEGTSDYYGANSYYVQPTAGSISAGWTQTPTGYYVAHLTAFK